jgi:hypothetical protein
MSTPRRKNATTLERKAQPLQRLNVRVEADAYKRLMVHCLMTGEQPGKIVNAWIDTYCKEWKLPASNHGSVKSEDRTSEAESISLAMETAA